VPTSAVAEEVAGRTSSKEEGLSNGSKEYWSSEVLSS